MLKTVAQCMNAALYAMVYGDEGTGKTRMITTLSERQDMADIGIITADESGPTSLAEIGGLSAKVWLLPGPNQDPFLPAITGIKTLRQDKTVKTIGLDACTVLSANAIQFLSGGAGGKALGFDGWQKILSGFLKIEAEAQKCVREGKNFIYTAWAADPTYVDTVGGRDLESPGRPWIHGQGKKWLPGKTDLIARLTSHHKRDGTWVGNLQVRSTEEWLAKTRWKLPDPVPCNLRQILKLVRSRRELATKGTSQPVK